MGNALVDLRDIKGQESAKRALEDRRRRRAQPADGRPARLRQVDAGGAPAVDPAAALARRGAGSLDDRIRSPARSSGGALTNRRPFRAPHHSARMPALVGGGLARGRARCRSPITACCSSTNCPSSPPQALDSLRQPLETGEVAIARANHRVTYPARFMLVAAMNPCRCGHASDPGFACRAGPTCAARQTTRRALSGPLLDRIDLHIEVPAVTAADLILPPPAEGIREVAARVARRPRDPGRTLSRRSACRMCAPMRPRRLGAGGRRAPDARAHAAARCRRQRCGSRRAAIHRVLRVARTLADLDGSDNVVACISPKPCPTAPAGRCSRRRREEEPDQRRGGSARSPTTTATMISAHTAITPIWSAP